MEPLWVGYTGRYDRLAFRLYPAAPTLARSRLGRDMRRNGVPCAGWYCGKDCAAMAGSKRLLRCRVACQGRYERTLPIWEPDEGPDGTELRRPGECGVVVVAGGQCLYRCPGFTECAIDRQLAFFTRGRYAVLRRWLSGEGEGDRADRWYYGPCEAAGRGNYLPYDSVLGPALAAALGEDVLQGRRVADPSAEYPDSVGVLFYPGGGRAALKGRTYPTG
jgi:hypothetical protein